MVPKSTHQMEKTTPRISTTKTGSHQAATTESAAREFASAIRTAITPAESTPSVFVSTWRVNCG